MARPRISLCLIARDEATFLPGCLASVADAVDQIVVVDTGSVDETVRLAREAGALVVHHVWNDDFSAARNAALPHATGEYILVLDADERLAPGAAAAIRDAVASRNLALGVLPLHNAGRLDASTDDVLSGRARVGTPVFVPRLVRKTADLAWEGLVHEGFRTWLDRHVNPSNFAQVQAPIVHLGAVPEVREAKRKNERNLQLLERMAALEPDLPNTWAHLASERARAGDGPGTLDAVEKGWDALLRTVGRAGYRPMSVPIASLRAKYAIQLGRYALALETIDQARRWGERHPNFGFYAGQAAEALDDHARAELEYRGALAMKEISVSAEVHEGASGWGSEYGLGMVLLRAGRAADALACFDRAAAERLDRSEIHLGRADAMLALRRPADALAILEPHLGEHAGDGWTLAAEAMCALGDYGTALSFAARGANGKYVEASRLVRRNAIHSRLSFHHGKPRAGDGPFGVLGALVSRVPVRTDAPVSAADVEEAVSSLVAAGRADSIEALLEPRAEDLVPGIGPWVHRALELHGLRWTDDDEPDVLLVGSADPVRVAEVCGELTGNPRTWLVERPPSSLLAEWRTRAGPPTDDLDADDAAARAWLLRTIGSGAPARRRLIVPCDLRDVEWLADRLPRARFLHVIPFASQTDLLPQVIEQRGRGSPLTSRLFELWLDEWLASRTVLLDRLWAFLGEPSIADGRSWNETSDRERSVAGWAL